GSDGLRSSGFGGAGFGDGGGDSRWGDGIFTESGGGGGVGGGDAAASRGRRDLLAVAPRGAGMGGGEFRCAGKRVPIVGGVRSRECGRKGGITGGGCR